MNDEIEKSIGDVVNKTFAMCGVNDIYTRKKVSLAISDLLTNMVKKKKIKCFNSIICDTTNNPSSAIDECRLYFECTYEDNESLIKTIEGYICRDAV